MHSSKPASRLCDAEILFPPEFSCVIFIGVLWTVESPDWIRLFRWKWSGIFLPGGLVDEMHGGWMPKNLMMHALTHFISFWFDIFFCLSRFSQQFIDIRENERKRSQRGVISIPPKIDEEKTLLQNETSNATTPIPPPRIENNSPGFKTEHLLELQEKITKEILSTKLNENEMHALQVSRKKMSKKIDAI